jgi:hypothetical protein
MKKKSIALLVALLIITLAVPSAALAVDTGNAAQEAANTDVQTEGSSAQTGDTAGIVTPADTAVTTTSSDTQLENPGGGGQRI